jgi:hypothetical protein
MAASFATEAACPATSSTALLHMLFGFMLRQRSVVTSNTTTPASQMTLEREIPETPVWQHNNTISLFRFVKVTFPRPWQPEQKSAFYVIKMTDRRFPTPNQGSGCGDRGCGDCGTIKDVFYMNRTPMVV